MKTLSDKLKVRRTMNRPMTSISIRIPEDLIGDLKEMAPLLGFGGYQALIRAYISHGMRRDEARLSLPDVTVTRAVLERHGVEEAVINEIVAEALRKTA